MGIKANVSEHGRSFSTLTCDEKAVFSLQCGFGTSSQLFKTQRLDGVEGNSVFTVFIQHQLILVIRLY